MTSGTSLSAVVCSVCTREEVAIVRVQKSVRGKLILTYRCKKRHTFDIAVPEETDCDIRVWGH